MHNDLAATDTLETCEIQVGQGKGERRKGGKRKGGKRKRKRRNVLREPAPRHTLPWQRTTYVFDRHDWHFYIFSDRFDDFWFDVVFVVFDQFIHKL